MHSSAKSFLEDLELYKVLESILHTLQAHQALYDSLDGRLASLEAKVKDLHVIHYPPKPARAG